MNIIVSVFGTGTHCVRPDTTLERESEIFYIPGNITELSYVPVMFVRACKAGKHVGEKFAERYYDCGGFGILLYGENLIREAGPAGFAMASSMDRTSYLPMPMYGRDVLANSGNIFTAGTDSCPEAFVCRAGTEKINAAIPQVTALTSVRTGDIIAVETGLRKPVLAGETITGCLNGETVISITVK